MDLVYIPEVMTFGSFRNQYRDYDQPWNQNYADYGKTATYQQQRRPAAQPPGPKEACHLCKENKRRALAAYIRGKARGNSCSEICEEEEAECDKAQDDTKKPEAPAKCHN